MRSQATLRPAFQALTALILLPLATSAAAQGRDTTVTVSSAPAMRASVLSNPIPVDPGGSRILFAPAGELPGDQFGNSVANAGDVNGDGYADVIVGAWTSDATGGDAGSAYIYYGGPGADDVPDLILRGQSAGDNFGTSVASAGDMNGDGYGDVIVGAWRSVFGASQAGRAYVFFGGSPPNPFPDLVLVGEAFGDQFGISVSSAGDLNGDGFSDVIVGAAGNDAGGEDAGRAYVYFGGITPNAIADLRLTGTAGEHFGYAVAPAGDVNNDRFDDVVIGAPESGGNGRAYLYLGGPSPDTVPDRIFTGEMPGDGFGTVVTSAGDLNADNYVDLAISAHHNDAAGIDAGRVYVFHGGPAADAIADRVLTGASTGDNFGQSVASAGDMNGDGFADLIVGAWLNDAGGLNAGRAYVYFGGPTMDDVPDMTLNGEAVADRLGVSVASAGDMNHDGSADVIVGAYFNDAAGQEVGRAYVVTRDVPHAPVVTAPATVAGLAGTPVSFSVTASDPDGDAIASLTATPLPAGATFTPNGTNKSGAFLWTPGASQTGNFDVTFTASNDRTGSATTRIQVASPNRPPVIAPVVDMSVNEGATADQVLHGSDPDGDPLNFGLASGPAFASVTAIDGVSGNLHLAPGFSDAGSYTATVQSTDGRGGTATASLTVVVSNTNRQPTLTVPAGVFGAEGVSFSIGVSATDPDGDHVRLGAINRPVGSLFVDFGNNSGSFSWTPGFGQSGTYTVTFTGRDDLGASAPPRDLTITVDNVNRGPVAAAGGPYAGVVNVPITFNGTGSSDPDGSVLSYLWNFGDQVTGSGVTPVHSYSTGGPFTVTLTVDDGALTASASTLATIQDVFPARAFTSGSNRAIKLGSGKAIWCADIEPVSGAFLTTAIIPSTITMKYGLAQIFAQAGKVSIGGDDDGNGIQEITACFSKANLRTLFAGLPKGTTTVTVTLEGDLSTGGKFRTTLTLDVVKNGGGALVASLSPNPLNPTATLTFVTSRPGSVSVSIFDLQGRLVRTLVQGEYLGAGYHEVLLDGRSQQGQLLSSGAYFYRINAAEGVVTGRFLIVK
jgi:hypothetical protein